MPSSARPHPLPSWTPPPLHPGTLPLSPTIQIGPPLSTAQACALSPPYSVRAIRAYHDASGKRWRRAWPGPPFGPTLPGASDKGSLVCVCCTAAVGHTGSSPPALVYGMSLHLNWAGTRWDQSCFRVVLCPNLLQSNARRFLVREAKSHSGQKETAFAFCYVRSPWLALLSGSDSLSIGLSGQ